MKQLFSALLLIILAFSPYFAYSQGEALSESHPQVHHQDIRFEHINRDVGLSHNSVFTIVQDQTGFLWSGPFD